MVSKDLHLISQYLPIFSMPSELTILQYLVENWYKWHVTKDLYKVVGLGYGTVYRAVKALKAKNLIQANGEVIRANILNNAVYNFKLFFDSYKLECLDKQTKTDINDIYSSVTDIAQDNLVSFFIFGSVARFEHTSSSDIDFFIILKQDQDVFKTRHIKPEKYNLLIRTKEQVKKMYLDGDDLLLSCLSNNLIIYDALFLRLFLSRELYAVPKNIISQRMDLLEKQKHRLTQSLAIKDFNTLVEDYKTYLISKARLILFEHNIIPLTKNQTLDAVKEYDSLLYGSFYKVNMKNVKEMVINEPY